MQLTFVNDKGQTYVIEVDPEMKLEDIMALLEVESEIPVSEQSISHNGQEVSGPNLTLQSAGIVDGSILLLRRKVTIAGRTAEQDAEMMRLQILGDPQLMGQLRATQPELADAVVNNPARFAEMLSHVRGRQDELELQRQRDIGLLNADPFDVEAQKRIEEAIRQQAVLENMEHAMEYSPESFGRVIMLYIPVEVNGRPVKAFVDSGAQQTIMSPECAESCGIMRLLDKRFSGIARGVGTAKILGRVHSAQLKVADLHLACSFTIMEGRDVDLLFGLDMLKAHQACIDLERNVLRIQGREVGFLPEHELPAQARQLEPPEPTTSAPSTSGNRSEGTSGSRSGGAPSFPGSGRSLGTTPGGTPAPRSNPAPPNAHSEEAVATLMGLGASREQAIQLLSAAGGNIDVAASLLFQ